MHFKKSGERRSLERLNTRDLKMHCQEEHFQELFNPEQKELTPHPSRLSI